VSRVRGYFPSFSVAVRVIDESGEDYLYPAGKFLLAEWPKAVEQAVLKAS
jgi:hypothetical protein